jgi:hypothetical protein
VGGNWGPVAQPDFPVSNRQPVQVPKSNERPRVAQFPATLAWSSERLHSFIAAAMIECRSKLNARAEQPLPLRQLRNNAALSTKCILFEVRHLANIKSCAVLAGHISCSTPATFWI